MIKAKVEIEGICPILFNRFTEAAMAQLEKGSSKKKTTTQYKDEALTKVYRKTPKGPIGIPTINIKKSMLDGCRKAGIKIGRGSAEPYMRAVVFFEEDFVSLGKKKPDGIHECTGRRPPRTGGRMIIRQPYADTGWKASFTIMSMDDRVGAEMVKGALEEAGLLIGLCDHRPEFGRFKVNKFEVVS